MSTEKATGSISRVSRKLQGNAPDPDKIERLLQDAHCSDVTGSSRTRFEILKTRHDAGGLPEPTMDGWGLKLAEPQKASRMTCSRSDASSEWAKFSS